LDSSSPKISANRSKPDGFRLGDRQLQFAQPHPEEATDSAHHLRGEVTVSIDAWLGTLRSQQVHDLFAPKRQVMKRPNEPIGGRMPTRLIVGRYNGTDHELRISLIVRQHRSRFVHLERRQVVTTNMVVEDTDVHAPIAMKTCHPTRSVLEAINRPCHD
jgi:hypothetical protein